MALGDAKKLLDFHFNASNFKELGKDFLDKDIVARNINRLEQTTAKLMNSQSGLDHFDLPGTIELIRSAFEKNLPIENVVLDKNSLRGLSYNLTTGDYPLNKYILEVLDANWSATFLTGLLHSLLSKWSEFGIEERKLINNYISKSVDSHRSKTSDNTKKLLKYLTDNGPYKLGHDLKKNDKSIYACCSVFLLPINRFGYSYFSDVIAGYYAQDMSIDIDEMRKVLENHNQISTNKKVLSHLICHYDKKGNVPNELISISEELIGDPFIISLWSPPSEGFSNNEEYELKCAREILTKIISSKFINAFFITLAQDKRRLNFWLKKMQYIKDFRVFGSYESRNKLGAIDIRLIRRHYSITKYNQRTCALVMFLPDYAIIEFTDTGALYVYGRENPMYSFLSTRLYEIDKMDDLKVPIMQKLIDDFNGVLTPYSEGKMVHIGDWEHRLEFWFNRMIQK